MSRKISSVSIRKHAIGALKQSIKLALDAGNYQAAGAFALQLSQIANAIDRKNAIAPAHSPKSLNPSTPPPDPSLVIRVMADEAPSPHP